MVLKGALLNHRCIFQVIFLSPKARAGIYLTTKLKNTFASDGEEAFIFLPVTVKRRSFF